jgi:hypothetical protein
MQRTSNDPLMQILSRTASLMMRRVILRLSLASGFLCRDGKTALLWATELNIHNVHDSTVLLLLEHHADVNAADR